MTFNRKPAIINFTNIYELHADPKIFTRVRAWPDKLN